LPFSTWRRSSNAGALIIAITARKVRSGGVKMAARHRHNITWAEAENDTAELAQEAYGAARVRSNYLSLNEPELVRFRRERADSLNIAITSVFPSAVFVQISNSLAVRLNAAGRSGQRRPAACIDRRVSLTDERG
jgi:hypothetical protein